MPKLVREKIAKTTVEIDENDLFEYLATAADPVSKVVTVRKALQALTQREIDGLTDYFEDSPGNLKVIDLVVRMKKEMEGLTV